MRYESSTEKRLLNSTPQKLLRDLYLLQLILKNEKFFPLGFRRKGRKDSRQRQDHAQMHRHMIQHCTFMKFPLSLDQSLQRE